jgi:hypothetical protein
VEIEFDPAKDQSGVRQVESSYSIVMAGLDPAICGRIALEPRG